MLRSSLVVRRGLAGHSKWANIKKKKGGLDAARADIFTKLSRTVEVASRLAKGDRSHHVLASAVARAKAARLPKKTMDAAIARGGETRTAGADVQFLTYEGSLPGGVGVVVEALTDNKNRTVNDLRTAFRRAGGALGAPNSVVWAWRRVGELRIAGIAGDAAHEALFDAASEHGAEDIGDLGDDDGVLVSCAADATAAVRDGVGAAGFEVSSVDLVWSPDAEVDVEEGGGDALLSALDALDDLGDVAAVFHNAAAGG